MDQNTNELAATLAALLHAQTVEQAARTRYLGEGGKDWGWASQSYRQDVDNTSAAFQEILNALIDARVEAKLTEREPGMSRLSAKQLAESVAHQIDVAERRARAE